MRKIMYNDIFPVQNLYGDDIQTINFGYHW